MKTRSSLKVFTLLMMLFAPSLAQAQDFLWAKQWGGGEGLVVDQRHNVYSVGVFSGTMNFDPGPGTFELTAFGDMDVFVSKLDRDGGFLWAKQLGGTSYTEPWGTALDDDGNVYIVGTIYGTADFDPGPGTFELTSIECNLSYVCKLDSSGNFIWAVAFECNDSGGGSIVTSVTVDGDYVYTAGMLFGTVDLDPGPGTFELTSDEGEGFVSKLDSAGNLIWARQLDARSVDSDGVVVDPDGCVYVVGNFYDTVDFDPGPGTFFLTSFGEHDGFVSKLDSAGDFVWARQLGGALGDAYRGVALDSSGNIYTVGTFSDTVDFDPGPGTFFLTASEGNYFVSKLDSAGNFVWAKQVDGGLYEVALDGRDSVYTVGSFLDTVDFDPSPGTFDLTSFGSSDAVVWKLDSAGNFVWAKQLGGPSGDGAHTLALDRSDNVYAGGRFSDTADFDPGTGTFFLTAIDGSDPFVWKFGYVDIRLENQDPTSIHFSPDSPSVSFDVVTGLLSALQADRNFSQATCLGTFSGNPAEEYSTPPVGDGYYYLARGLSCCTTQGYGDSTLIPDPRDDLNAVSPCP